MTLMNGDSQKIVDAALAVQPRAYAPYSQFFVGAAILTKAGNVYVGCNVENASYGLAICAERSAVCAMVAAGETEPVAIAVCCPGGGSPCGACRQVLAEFGVDYRVLIVDSDTRQTVAQWRVGDLIPGVFRLDH